MNFVVLGIIAGCIAVFVLTLIGKQLWPKILFLVISLIGLAFAGFLGYRIYEENSSHVDAEIISIEYISENEYNIECQYTYKNKIYRSYLDWYYFEEELQIGSTISVYVSKQDPSKAYIPAECGTAMAFLYVGFYLFLIGGLIIFIPTMISLIIFCIKKGNHHKAMQNPHRYR